MIGFAYHQVKRSTILWVVKMCLGLLVNLEVNLKVKFGKMVIWGRNIGISSEY